jgi:tRNA nucleotidyltransferase/poly(A) polymerase
MQGLSPELARAARDVARRVAAAGARAWIVGGAVRDLALGAAPVEIDMASALVPEAVEHAFGRTVPLGRAFGTLLLHAEGCDVEHTTFRSESGYSDRRRPDLVRFGTSVAEDASRRDFTCNAIYLDPLTDEVQDPTGGLPDLEARRLATVGDARARFAEDALRPLRMARFAAALELEPDPAALRGARELAPGLGEVSRERVLRELEALFRRGRGAARFLELLEACALLEPALPGFEGLHGRDHAARRRALAALPAAPGTAAGVGVLLGPDPRRGADRAGITALVEGLRASRALQAELERAWGIGLEAWGAAGPARSLRVRWMRNPGFDAALSWLVAWSAAHERDAGPWRALERERADLGAQGLTPVALLAAGDLAAAGVPRGPAWGEILRELETLQLDGALTTRAEALEWLARRAG